MFRIPRHFRFHAAVGALLLVLAPGVPPQAGATVPVEFPGPEVVPSNGRTTAGCELPSQGGAASRFVVGTDQGYLTLMAYQAPIDGIRNIGFLLLGGTITGVAALPDPGDLTLELVVATANPDRLVFVNLGQSAPYLTEGTRLELEEDPGAVAALTLADGSTPRVVVALPGIDLLVTAIRDGEGWSREAATDAGDRPAALAATDLDGDGAAELVVANAGALSRSLHVFRPAGGALQLDQELLMPQAPGALTVLPPGSPTAIMANAEDAPLIMTVGVAGGALTLEGELDLRVLADDLDSAPLFDGRVGVFAASRSRGLVEVLLSTQSGWIPGEVYYPSCRPTRLLSADFNGDALVDVVSLGGAIEASTVMFGSGAGTLHGYPVLSLSGKPGSVALGDADLDGDTDVMVGIGDGSSLNTFLGSDSGLQPAPRSQELPFAPGAMVLLQVDADAAPELVVVDQVAGDIEIMEWDGVREFRSQGRLDLNFMGLTVVGGDVDNDGFQDLVVLGGIRPEIRICYGAGDGTFPDVRIESFLWQARDVLTVDLDGDGLRELVSTDGLGRVSYQPNEGGRTFGTETRLNADSGSRHLVLGDLDRDLDQDVVVVNVEAGSLTLLENDGTGDLVRRIGSYALGTTPAGVLVEDVNQDGELDLVVNQRMDGVISIHFGLGNWTFTLPQLFVGGDDVTIFASDDFNGDLVPDLLTLDATLELGLTMLNVERVTVANEPAALRTRCLDDGLQVHIEPGDAGDWFLEGRIPSGSWRPLAEPGNAVLGSLESRGDGWLLVLGAEDLAVFGSGRGLDALRLSSSAWPQGAVRVDVPDCGGRNPLGLAWISEPWPNPFNPLVHARISLDRGAHVAAGVYDLRGRLVKTLLAEEVQAGVHPLRWDGRGEGGPAAAGVYLLRVTGGPTVLTRKLMLVK